MPTITLPDGAKKPFDRPVSGAELAASIGPGLAKAALAIRLDGEVIDLSHVIDHDATPEASTFKAHFPSPDQLGSPEDMQPEPYCIGWE